MPKKRAASKKTVPDRKRKRKLHEEAQDRFETLLDLWQTAASDPSAQNLRKLAEESAALEKICRSIRTQAETFASSSQASIYALKTIQANAPGPARVQAPGLVDEEVAIGPSQLIEESFSKGLFGAPADEREEAEKPDMDLKSFFQQVSDSVVKAQQRLDMASIAYVQNAKDSPIPPAFYSIPNVKAEVKLGFTVQDGANIFVKLFGKPEDVSNYAESTVSFEVVASPPPPGGPGTYSAPIPHFLVVGPERERVAAAIAGMRERIKSATEIDVADPSHWLPNAIILRSAANAVPAANQAEYTVILRGSKVTDACLVVRLTLAKPDSAQYFKETDGKTALVLFDLITTVRDWESSITVPALKP